MNIRIDRDINPLFQIATGNRKKIQDKNENKNGKIISGEELMIQQFKEQNSKENNRIAEIWGKFKAGNDLTPEELEYLAKESPELYRQIKEIIMEREAMERQMEQAESKEEVAQIHANQMQKIHLSMGHGEEAAAQAEKTMARVNQIGQAYREFTASVEYAAKEDVESRTEEMRDMLKELEWQQEIYRDMITDKTEVNETVLEDVYDSKISEEVNHNEDYATEKKTEENEDIEKRIEENEGKSRRRKKRKTQFPLQNDILAASVDYKDLYTKVREMYRENTSVSNVTESKGKKINIPL